MEAKPLTRKGQEARERILVEARDVLVKQGLDHLVMRDIAASCGMKLGNLQYYFKSREDLLFAVIERESEGDIRAMTEQLSGNVDATITLKKVVERLLARWSEEDGAAVYVTLNLYQLHNESFRGLYQSIYANHYRALEGVLKQLKPELSLSERRMRVQLLSALVDGALYRVVSGGGAKFTRRVSEQAVEIALSS